MSKTGKRVLTALLCAAAFLSFALLAVSGTGAKAQTAGNFYVSAGAEIRAAEPYGIRFQANFDKTVYDGIFDGEGNNLEGKSLGFIIVPYTYVQAYENYKTENSGYAGTYYEYFSTEKKMLNTEFSSDEVYYDETADTYRIRFAITNLKFDSVNIEFVGIAYIAESTADGTVYTYTAVEESMARSAAELAESALGDENAEIAPEVESYLKEILKKSELKMLGATESTGTMNFNREECSYADISSLVTVPVTYNGKTAARFAPLDKNGLVAAAQTVTSAETMEGTEAYKVTFGGETERENALMLAGISSEYISANGIKTLSFKVYYGADGSAPFIAAADTALSDAGSVARNAAAVNIAGAAGSAEIVLKEGWNTVTLNLSDVSGVAEFTQGDAVLIGFSCELGKSVYVAEAVLSEETFVSSYPVPVLAENTLIDFKDEKDADRISQSEYQFVSSEKGGAVWQILTPEMIGDTKADCKALLMGYPYNGTNDAKWNNLKTGGKGETLLEIKMRKALSSASVSYADGAKIALSQAFSFEGMDTLDIEFYTVTNTAGGFVINVYDSEGHSYYHRVADTSISAAYSWVKVPVKVSALQAGGLSDVSYVELIAVESTLDPNLGGYVYACVKPIKFSPLTEEPVLPENTIMDFSVQGAIDLTEQSVKAWNGQTTGTARINILSPAQLNKDEALIKEFQWMDDTRWEELAACTDSVLEVTSAAAHMSGALVTMQKKIGVSDISSLTFKVYTNVKVDSFIFYVEDSAGKTVELRMRSASSTADAAAKYTIYTWSDLTVSAEVLSGLTDIAKISFVHCAGTDVSYLYVGPITYTLAA